MINESYIRDRMAELGIVNISRLANAAHLHRHTVRMALKRNSCSLETLAALAAVLQCQPGDLLTADTAEANVMPPTP